jgi:hypothetical protein
MYLKFINHLSVLSFSLGDSSLNGTYAAKSTGSHRRDEEAAQFIDSKELDNEASILSRNCSGRMGRRWLSIWLGGTGFP